MAKAIGTLAIREVMMSVKNVKNLKISKGGFIQNVWVHRSEMIA